MARDTERVMAPDLGLDAALGSTEGLNVFAAGLGLNSMALTLYFKELADVGLRTVLAFCGLF